MDAYFLSAEYQVKYIQAFKYGIQILYNLIYV